MKTRIISALCMVPFAIFIFLGGIPLFAFVTVLAFCALHEFFHGYEQINIHPHIKTAYAATALLYIFTLAKITSSNITDQAFILKHINISTAISFWLYLVVAVCLGLTLAIKDHNIQDGPVTVLGLIYISFNFIHISLVNSLEHGNIYVWLIFLIAFGNDTFAYFGGYFFGKHKLAPVISPKKTTEGSISGVLVTVICSCIFSAILLPEKMLTIALITLAGSPISQIGDLVASSFKRKMGIKDYSNLIPGHGGILDRFDSVIMVAPFVYYCLEIFG